MGDVIRGVFARALAAGVVSLLWVGDSITLPYNIFSVAGTCNMRWQVPCLGARSGNQNSGGSGWPIQVSNWGGTGATHQVLRPGDLAPDGSSGFMMMQGGIGIGSGDMTNFGSPITVTVNPTGTAIPNWDTDKMVEAIMTGRTDPLAANPDLLRIQYWNRANTFLGELSNVDFDQPTGDRTWRTVPYQRGSGVFNNNVARLSLWSENETGAIIKTSTFGIRVVGATYGIFWGYTGHGSWTPQNHSTQAGFALTPQAEAAYTGRYDDSALINDHAAYKWNVVIVWLGANHGNLTKEQFKAQMRLIRERQKMAARAAGNPEPVFVFVSQYDLANDNTITRTQAAALEELVRDEFMDADFFDARQTVENTLGAYSVFAPVDLNVDGVHPHGSRIRNLIADTMFAKLTGPPNVRDGGKARDRGPERARLPR